MNGRAMRLAETRCADEGCVSSVDIERLLESSADRFAEQGFDGVSMRDIGRACGCAVASIYYHFPSKAELYRESHANRLERSIEVIAARLGAVADRGQRFETLIAAFHELFTGDRTLLLLVQRDVIDAVSGETFQSRAQFEFFVCLLRRVAGEARGTPLGLDTAHAVGALVFGQCQLSMLAPDGPGRGAALLAERAALVRAAKAIVGM